MMNFEHWQASTGASTGIQQAHFTVTDDHDIDSGHVSPVTVFARFTPSHRLPPLSQQEEEEEELFVLDSIGGPGARC